MFEWLKRLVARRELEELDRWRMECVEARRWFGEFPEVAHALDYLARFATGAEGGRIDQARAKMRGLRAAAVNSAAINPFMAPLRVPPEHVAPSWLEQFAREWHAADHTAPRGATLSRGGILWAEPTPDAAARSGPAHRAELPPRCDGGIDYRFLGVTGEEDL